VEKFIIIVVDNGEQFYPGVGDTGQKYPKSLKFIADVNDTTEKLFTGVYDTADYFFLRCQQHW
jgi:hypothetical protein